MLFEWLNDEEEVCLWTSSEFQILWKDIRVSVKLALEFLSQKGQYVLISR
jgi:hypothetical protein